VLILLDSITRLACAYKSVIPPSGKVPSGGLDSNALQKAKGFLAPRHETCLIYVPALTIGVTTILRNATRE
jgi:transcription termination factor Rho